MSRKTHLLPAAAITALFLLPLASCNSDSANEAKRMNDSIAVSYNSVPPADESRTETEKQNRYDLAGSNNESDGWKQQEANQKVMLDSIGKVLPTSAAALTRLDSSHLFIRTADVKCRVDEVDDATYRVEDVVRNLNGYISDTRLASNQTWSQQTQVSDDSIRQVNRFVVTNTITIRVPARNLDSLLRALVPLVQYMDYRNVNVNDITIDQLAQQLEQKRIAAYNAMLKEKVVDGNTKASNIMDAAASILAQQEQSDNAYLESLRLKDQVSLATLSLQLYQPETSEITMLFHEKPLEPYEPGIGERIGNAAYAGWKGLSIILTGLVLLWPLWVIGAIVFYFVRRQMKKTAKAL